MQFLELLAKAVRRALQESEDIEENISPEGLSEVVYNALQTKDVDTLVEIFTSNIEQKKIVTAVQKAVQRIFNAAQADFSADAIVDCLETLVIALDEAENGELRSSILSYLNFPLKTLSTELLTKVKLMLPTNVEDALGFTVQEELESAETLEEMVQKIKELIAGYKVPPDIQEGGWDTRLVAAVSEISSDVVEKVAAGEIPVDDFKAALDEIATAIEEATAETASEAEELKAIIVERLIKAIFGNGETYERGTKLERIRDLVRRIAMRRLQQREEELLEEEPPAGLEEEEEIVPPRRKDKEAHRKKVIVRSIVDGLLGALFGTEGEAKYAVRDAISEFAQRFGEDAQKISAVYDII